MQSKAAQGFESKTQFSLFPFYSIQETILFGKDGSFLSCEPWDISLKKKMKVKFPLGKLNHARFQSAYFHGM